MFVDFYGSSYTSSRAYVLSSRDLALFLSLGYTITVYLLTILILIRILLFEMKFKYVGFVVFFLIIHVFF